MNEEDYEKIVKEESMKLEKIIYETTKKIFQARMDGDDITPVTSGALAFITFKYISEAIEGIIYRAIRDVYGERLAFMLKDGQYDMFGKKTEIRDDPAYR